MTERVRLQITGRVQGVGFRWFTREKARRWGLVGWVRNQPDGSVEVVIEGDAISLEGLVRMLRQGPPGAFVEEVKRSDYDGSDPLPDPFTVLKG